MTRSRSHRIWQSIWFKLANQQICYLLTYLSIGRTCVLRAELCSHSHLTPGQCGVFGDQVFAVTHWSSWSGPYLPWQLSVWGDILGHRYPQRVPGNRQPSTSRGEKTHEHLDFRFLAMWETLSQERWGCVRERITGDKEKIKQTVASKHQYGLNMTLVGET